MSEDTAVSVIDEASRKYYDNFDKLSPELKRKISCHMLHDIFNEMVVPAIDVVRKLDRDHEA